MTRLFLDCEWADVIGSELVSLALVSADGQQRFYAEASPLPSQPTDFVRYVVYPLLEHGWWAMPHHEITHRLRAFLSGIGAPVVIYDHHVDGALLNYVLDGFDLPNIVIDAYTPRPSPRLWPISRDANLNGMVEAYFASHPEAADRRHNASVDAEALRQAWCAMADLITTDWSDRAIARLREQRLPATVVDPENTTDQRSAMQ